MPALRNRTIAIFAAIATYLFWFEYLPPLARVHLYSDIEGFHWPLFTAASIALSLTPGHGSSAALFLIVFRVVQGIGGALLMANSTASSEPRDRLSRCGGERKRAVKARETAVVE